MHFLHPEILWGLFALLIPIAIHLFNFRRYKRISFSNVAFLTEVKAETNKASRLRNLIILLIRLFLFSAIIIAFAQPFIPTSQSDALKGQRAISIYIDNSYSNQNLNQGIATLEWHKEKARSVVQSFSSFDKFQILTNDISGKDGQSLTQEEALLAIQNIQFSPSSNNLNEINERQNNYFGKVGADVHLHYWFSDFQKTMADIQLPSVDSSHLYVAIPTFPDDKNNISLDSIYFKSNQRVLNQADTLEVLVTNHGTSSQSATLQLEIDGSQKAVATNELESGQQLKIQLQFSTTSGGLHQGKVSLADEFVPFDNQLYFSYQLAEQIHVLEFTGNEKKATRALFENDSQYSFESRSIENFNSEIDQRIQFLILQGIMQFSAEQTGWIESFIDKGGHAFILPHSNADLVSYNDLLGRLGSVQMLPKSDIPIVAQNFEIKDPFYAPAFEKLQENTTMPSAEKRFPLANNNLSSVSLIHFQDNSPLLCYTKKGNGRIYVSSVSAIPLESNFTQHALFPVSLVRAAELSGYTTPLYATLADNSFISLSRVTPSANGLYTLKNMQSNQEFIAQSRNNGTTIELFIPNEISTAGYYEIASDSSTVGGIALNYTRSESPVNFYSSDELKLKMTNVPFSVEDATPEMLNNLATKLAGGKTYWWTLILIALFLLALEILVIQLWKTKS